ADTRPDGAPPVGGTQPDAGAGGEARRSSGPGRYIQAGRSGQDALAAATGGGEGERGGRGCDAADVDDPGPAAGGRRGADAAGERAAAAVGNRAAVLPLGGTGGGDTSRRNAADVGDSAATAGRGRGADAAVECAPAAVGNRTAVLRLCGAGGGDAG